MDKLTKVANLVIRAFPLFLHAIMLGTYLGVILSTILGIIEIFCTQRWSAIPVFVVIVIFDCWLGKILLEDPMDE